MERISNGRNLARLARRLALVAAVATIGAVGLGAAPASADDGWHRGREAYRAQQLRQREWREHAWRAHERWERRVRYVPAPVPRPRIYAPAPVAPSFNLVIPLNIR